MKFESIYPLIVSNLEEKFDLKNHFKYRRLVKQDIFGPIYYIKNAFKFIYNQ